MTRAIRGHKSLQLAVVATILCIGGQIACTTLPHPEPAPADEPTVEAACQRLRDIGCEAGEPTPDGATCEQWMSALNDLPGPSQDLACIASASTCEAADACGTQ